MRDLSLHLLDLAQNSIAAGAKLVTVRLVLDGAGILRFTLEDDGRGMTPELLARVKSPFSTTRTTRKVGLGIPMMMENARLTGGDLEIRSEEGKGTTLLVTLNTRSIDCLPLGDLAGTMTSLILANPERPDFRFEGEADGKSGAFDTREVRRAVGGLPLNEPEIASWISEALQETINPIFGGVKL